MKRLTHKNKEDSNYSLGDYRDRELYSFVNDNNKLLQSRINKLGQYEDIEEELGIDLITLRKGIDPKCRFMEINEENKMDFCGDAYYGTYPKEEVLELFMNLIYMYKQMKELENDK